MSLIQNLKIEKKSNERNLKIRPDLISYELDWIEKVSFVDDRDILK